MITLHNEELTVQVNELGAQLHSIQRNDNHHEYLWQGDPASWKRQAPILFPFVGRLKDDQYIYEGKTYHQTQHGFARDREFAVLEQTATKLVLEQHDDEKTHQVFPFAFSLVVSFELIAGTVDIHYLVKNTSSQNSLLYAIGAHPGFNMPLHGGDVTLAVTPAEEYSRIVLDGPYNDSTHPQLINMRTPRQLIPETFSNDALIFQTAGEHFSATLTDQQSQFGVTVNTHNTEFVGVWSPYPAKGQFVCIEPWWGIADNVQADGQLLHKQGMHRLAPTETDQYHFSIRPF